MARFFGKLKGNRTKSVTKLGDAQSGLTALVNGWKMGVEVRLYVLNDMDTVDIYLNTGSEGSARGLIYRGTETDIIEKVRRMQV